MKQIQINALNIFQNVTSDSTFEFFEKGKRAEVGSIHTWSDGVDYRKTTDGWVKVSEVKIKDYNLNLKLTTEDQFCKDGNWDKNRVEKLHKPIIEKFKSEITKTSKEPVVTLMMGAPASGKGTILRYLKANEKEYENLPDVNPDHIKTEDLGQDYNEYQKYSTKSAAKKVHEEGSYLSKQIIKEYDKLGAHYVQDKCFAKYDSLIKEIDRLGQLGVKVKIMMVSCPYEIALWRMLERGKETGRYVPRKYFYNQHKNIEETYQKLIADIPKNVTMIRNYYNGEELKLIKQIDNEKTQ